MGKRLQWAMVFLLICICAPPLLALWVNNVGAIPKPYSLSVLGAGLAGLLCYLVWKRNQR